MPKIYSLYVHNDIVHVLESLVFIQSGAATPFELIRGMTQQGVCDNLRGVRVIHLALEGDTPFANPEFQSKVTTGFNGTAFRLCKWVAKYRFFSGFRNTVFWSAEHFRSVSLYIGANLREAVNEGRADYIPVFIHEAPQLFYKEKIIPDVALIHVSSPDDRGFCSLGTNVDITRAAICKAKVIIGESSCTIHHLPTRQPGNERK